MIADFFLINGLDNNMEAEQTYLVSERHQKTPLSLIEVLQSACNNQFVYDMENASMENKTSSS